MKDHALPYSVLLEHYGTPILKEVLDQILVLEKINWWDIFLKLEITPLSPFFYN